MKVNGSTDGIRADLAAGKPASKASTGVAAPASSTPNVRLSGASAKLQAGESEAAFDAGKVDQLKQAIRSGQFSVDSGVVADKMIASVNDLFGPVH